MRYAPRALLAGGLGVAMSWLVACGGGAGLLSSNQSSSLSGQLDAISSAVESGNCGGATQAVGAFAQTVTDLPASVSPTLRANLLQGASTVASLAARDCTTTPATTSPTTTNTTTTTTTTTPETTTAPPTTTTPATTTAPPTTTSPATTTTPPGTTTTTGGAGIGGGSSSGNSGGGGTGNNG